jgi:glucose/arabinose dehydrogenase
MRAATVLSGSVLFVSAAIASAIGPIDPAIPKGTVTIGLVPVATGLTSAVDMTTDGGGRLFVSDQTGKVRVIQNGSLLPTPFLDLSSTMVTLRGGYDERGLLGFALHPDFNNPDKPGYHKVYTYSSDKLSGPADFTVPLSGATFDNQGVVAEYTVSATNPNVVDPASRRVILRMDHPQFNHDGGELSFGPDGMLYLGIGDGGNANDKDPTGVTGGHNPVTGNARDLTTVMGKVLRIDVNTRNSANGQYGIPADNPFVSGAGGALKEIYAYGFRNPYRFSFAADGRLVVADVGQNNIEEIDIVEAGKNYGWNLKEGTFLFDPATGNIGANSPGSPGGLVDPVAEYDHDEGIAIVGGFVYRGSLIPGLQGKYVFGDFSKSFGTPSGRLFYADLSTGQISEFINGASDLPLGLYVKGFGEDANGELYLLASTTLGPTGTNGRVLAIVPEPGAMAPIAGAPALLGRRRRK